MKNYPPLFAVLLALSNLSALGGPLMDSYWPLNSGDQKTFLYGNNQPLTITINDSGTLDASEIEMVESSGVASPTLVMAEDQANCYMTAVRSGWLTVSMNPEVVLLNEDILQNGGEVKTSTTVSQRGISYPATFTVRVADAGTITVLAGTFTGCKSITSTEVARVPGRGTITAKALTAYLAPTVGIIKTLVAPGQWAQLVNGTVGGVPVGNASFTPLTVEISGEGTVKPNDNGRWFPSGQILSMTATPKAGQIFANWTDASGNIRGATPKLSVTMQSNLVLQANFVPNPFAPVAGAYAGLFIASSGVTPENSGLFTATVSDKGAFSAKLRFAAASVPFTGHLDGNGYFSNALGGGSVAVSLSASLGYANGQISGYVTGQGWTATLYANQSVLTGGQNPAPEYGKYTMTFSGASGFPTLPGGNGYGTVTVDRAGRIVLSAVLADGTPITQAAVLSEGGMWPFYASLYGGQGSILGWLTVNNGSSTAIAGSTFWNKRVMPAAKLYPAGFDITNSVTGSSYVPPQQGASVLSFSQGDVILSGGDLASTFTNVIAIGSGNKVTDLSDNKLTLSFKPSVGLFQGTVVNPSAPGSKPFYFGGVVLQSQGEAAGFFSDMGQTGAVSIEQAPQVNPTSD